MDPAFVFLLTLLPGAPTSSDVPKALSDVPNCSLLWSVPGSFAPPTRTSVSSAGWSR